MNKLLLAISLVAACCLTTGCDPDDGWDGWRGNDYYWGNDGYKGDKNVNQALNGYEKQLVGSYVSADDKTTVYLVLNSDRTGTYTTSEKTLKFYWWADNDEIEVAYYGDDEYYDMDYYSRNGYLYIDGIPFTTNNGGNGGGESTQQSNLVGQWSGELQNYYTSMYPTLDPTKKYATMIEYAQDGTGAQLDYDVTAPTTNYAFVVFEWKTTSRSIVMVYDDDANGNPILPTATIKDFALMRDKFTGSVIYGDKSYGFEFARTSGFDWSPYTTRAAGDTRLEARQLLRSLVKNGVKAKRSGIFAK